MTETCWKETESQIEKEITASLKYLWLAAYFSKDNVNRPGFAKFFFEAASEEREHAYKLIEYLSMRGQYLPLNSKLAKTFDISELVHKAADLNVLGTLLIDPATASLEKDTTSGLIALQNALN